MLKTQSPATVSACRKQCTTNLTISAGLQAPYALAQCARPTRWAEIVDSSPTCLDALGLGMGGVWLSTTSKSPALLWHSPFDHTITNKLVTTDNPTGTITNSDLEQLALACHPDILTSIMDVCEQTICALSESCVTDAAPHQRIHPPPSSVAWPPFTNGPTGTVSQQTTSRGRSM
jgi:hypothetical protein